MELKEIIKNATKIIKILLFIYKYRNDERVKNTIANIEAKKFEINALKEMKKNAKDITEEITTE